MIDRYADEAVIRRVLIESKTWAFVGLRDNPGRTAHDMAVLLKSHGKTIVPVHPSTETVLGEKGYPTLAAVPVPIDVVGVYRRTAHAGDVADEAIAVGAKAVWFPLNVIDREAADRVLAAGLDVVMNRCPAIEWPRLNLPD